MKLAATRLVELVGTWDDSQGDLAGASQRLVAAEIDPVLAEQAADLLHDDAAAAAVAVDYPQYGGLTTTDASVMTLLTQQLLLPDGSVVDRQVVLDVRVERASTDEPWRVTAVGPDPDTTVVGDVSPAAAQVLSNPNLRLPEPAVRDIEEGRMDDSLLELLNGLAAEHVLDLHVLYRGHPTNVFDTERASNHSIGRAFDIWRIDDQLVVDPDTPDDLLSEVMVDAATLGATEIGGPFDVNGDQPGFFTDQVHQDHIHVGISAGRPPALP
ncbi:hypothetical protein [Aquipuribacter sp. MA13-6]|uniref:hypothetical protein n=1 Tax=unclassified Aquipuribacter TaxID=2635084 RepID=UPI003EEB605C